ncbi:MAG: sulfatase [Acidobacteriota bacterium]
MLSKRLTYFFCAAIFALSCAAPEAPPPDTPNVVLVVVDTLGARHVGAWGGEAETPRIDRLAKTGCRFSRAFAPTPWTQPTIASLFTGRMPHEHGVVRLFDSLDESHVTLAERLADAGYDTAAVVSHHLIGRKYGYGQGFDVYDDAIGDDNEGITGGAVTDQAIAWLRSRGDDEDPYFLFVHYFDPHMPYLDHDDWALTVPGYYGPIRPGMGAWEMRELRGGLDEDDRRQLRALYLEEIAYTDREVGRLLDVVDAMGEDTMTLFTADHGEELLEHGWIGHTRTLFDELLHVPLVVAKPGKIAPCEIDVPVSVLDLMPTILDVAQAPAERETTGRSLLPLVEGEELAMVDLFAEVSFTPWSNKPERVEKTAFATALIRGDLKIIHDLGAGRWSLYDRGVDPAEQSNLFGRHPASRELKRDLMQWSADRKLDDSGPRLEPDTETVERLRALGYAM